MKTVNLGAESGSVCILFVLPLCCGVEDLFLLPWQAESGREGALSLPLVSRGCRSPWETPARSPCVFPAWELRVSGPLMPSAGDSGGGSACCDRRSCCSFSYVLASRVVCWAYWNCANFQVFRIFANGWYFSLA